MSHTSTSSTNAAAPDSKKPRGKPFAKGGDPRRDQGFTGADDPRRNNNGQLNKAAVAFGKQVREMLIEEGLLLMDGVPRIERVIRRLYDAAEAGEAWAVTTLLDRIEGKVTQQHGDTGADTLVLVLRGDASLSDL